MARTDRLDEDIERIIGSREEGNIGKCMKHFAYKDIYSIFFVARVLLNFTLTGYTRLA
jgi:hypothetical protein